MDIGEGLKVLKKDGEICLPHWGSDVYLALQTDDGDSYMTAPYIYVTSRFGRVPWVATQIELLSEKWEKFVPGSRPV